MTQINIDLPAEVVNDIRQRAEGKGITIARYVTDHIHREASHTWPEGFFKEVAGCWQGSSLIRPPQGEVEPRKAM